MDTIARQTAQFLLDTGAIAIAPNTPFTLTSGLISPVYVDCRRLISFPLQRKKLIRFLMEKLEATVGLNTIDVVAGGETAGIPYAAWLADAMDKPMLYVRKKPKGFGRNAQIEGVFEEGSRVLLAEDLATDGGSKLIFVEALRAAGAVVHDTCVVFHYDIFPYKGSALEQAGIRLHSLATWAHVLEVAKGSIPDTDLAAVRSFLNNPDAWRANHA